MGLIAARTDKDAKAAHGISLFLVDTRDHPGFKKGKTLKKIGQPTYDTAEVTCHVTHVILTALKLYLLVIFRRYSVTSLSNAWWTRWTQ